MQKEKKQPSPWPYYLVGAVWLIYGRLFPLYRWWDFLIAALLSAVVFWIGKKIFPGKKVLIELPDPPPASTNDPLADRVLSEGREYVRQLNEVNRAIPDPKLTQKIDRITELSEKIFGHIAQYPGKAPQVRKFLDYYLPTTLKLLRSYDVLDEQAVPGENIAAAMAQIEAAMDKIVPAFERQLDALFHDEALDIMTDITVLEGMLEQEGLGTKAFEINEDGK